MSVRCHRNDLPDGFRPGPSLSVDTETKGLNPHRDRLCV
ncbi:MAG: ribonuclease D, partial [Methylobacteriaceae bacterium]|nr:ribonuclease D [Methylobacteriaceae bacterium]